MREDIEKILARVIENSMTIALCGALEYRQGLITGGELMEKRRRHAKRQAALFVELHGLKELAG